MNVTSVIHFFRKIVLVLVLAVSVAACGSVSHHASFIPDFEPAPGSQIGVGQVTDAASIGDRGEQADFDVVGELRRQLETQLAESGLKAEQGSASTYILNAKIVEYVPGSAIGRWLWPGNQPTKLTVECTLMQGEKEVAKVSALRSVTSGGFYTIGAWKSVFGDVAKDVVLELKQKLAPQAAS